MVIIGRNVHSENAAFSFAAGIKKFDSVLMGSNERLKVKAFFSTQWVTLSIG